MTKGLRAILSRRGRSPLGAEGSVALELAVLTPFLMLLFFGLVDFGYYFTSSQAIAAATRIGAEYARDSATCQSSTTGIQPLTNTIGAPCTTGIEDAMQNAMNFNPKLTFSSAPSLSCYCDGDTQPAVAFTCSGYSCTTNGRGNNEVFVTVSAHQAFTPIIASPGFLGFPTSAAAFTEIRIQ